MVSVWGHLSGDVLCIDKKIHTHILPPYFNILTQMAIYSIFCSVLFFHFSSSVVHFFGT